MSFDCQLTHCVLAVKSCTWKNPVQFPGSQVDMGMKFKKKTIYTCIIYFFIFSFIFKENEGLFLNYFLPIFELFSSYSKTFFLPILKLFLLFFKTNFILSSNYFPPIPPCFSLYSVIFLQYIETIFYL